jgi:hypothetical protein
MPSIGNCGCETRREDAEPKNGSVDETATDSRTGQARGCQDCEVGASIGCDRLRPNESLISAQVTNPQVFVNAS